MKRKERKKICLLINTTANFETKNCSILSEALLNKKRYDVYLCLINTLTLNIGRVWAKVLKIDKNISIGDTYKEEAFKYIDLSSIDYLWILSFCKKGFLDHIEMLWILNRKIKIINSIESLMFLNNKYCLSSFSDLFLSPKTYASCSFDYLWSIYEKYMNDIWVIKPPAESMGSDVFLLRPKDTNARVLIQSMTGTGRYCLLQKYVPNIENGEKRIVIANGRIICFYLRKIRENYPDHRTNLHQGATPLVCDLSEKERQLCNKVGKELKKIGAYFIGIDLVYPYILEINIISPGGLKTVYDLTGTDFSGDVIDSIFED